MKSSECIVFNIEGGLGNQLFQYAASLSFDNSNVLYDISSYRKDKNRNFELGFLCNRLLVSKFSHRLAVFLLKVFLLIMRDFIVEKEFENGDLLTKKVLGVRLAKGYWQNPIYFSNKKEFILNSLFNGKGFSSAFLDLVSKVENSNDSISLHIRRGDYVTDEIAKNKHLVCTESYYRSALAYVESICSVNNSKLVMVFSDDIDWAKSVFSGEEFLFVDANILSDPLENILLMSLCDHNVLSNSSFSWWGGWLNKSNSKVVCVPPVWYADITEHCDSIYFSECFKIEV